MKLAYFRFRLWHDPNKSSVEETKEALFRRACNMSVNDDDYKNMEIELWSGRIDSYGNYIYEGDIVESVTPLGKTSYFWISDVTPSSSPTIEMIDKGTSRHYKSYMDEMTGEFDVDKWEYTNSLKVIGNIHENPEIFNIKDDKEKVLIKTKYSDMYDSKGFPKY